MDEVGTEWQADAEVMSDVHIGSGVGIKSMASVFWISTSGGNQPAQEEKNERRCDCEGQAASEDEGDNHGVVEIDEHGDLVLPRRKKKSGTEKARMDTVVVQHHLRTRLGQVGLQIWRGALLLSDFILHVMCTSSDLDRVIALELGAGTGLAGLIMARVAALVFITDKGADILDNCTRNVFLNVGSLSKGEPTVRVRELDWQMPWPPDISTEGEIHQLDHYRWTSEDIRDAGQASVLLAADVIYSTDLTTAFFDMLKNLMPPNCEKVLYLALEKRYNFSLADLDVVAHCYKHFLNFINSDNVLGLGSGEGSSQKLILDPTPSIVHHFHGKQIDVSSIPQYITNYERGKDLELWEIRSCCGTSNHDP